MKKVKTPELDKMLIIASDSQTISGFLEWLKEKEIQLAEWSGSDCEECGGEHLVYMVQTKEQLLANYFSIDLAKAERERQALFDEMRAANEKQG